VSYYTYIYYIHTKVELFFQKDIELHPFLHDKLKVYKRLEDFDMYVPY
jgi:hypothetical protein